MSFNDRLGLRRGAEPGTVELDPTTEHEIVPDTIHFAVLATLAEVAAAQAAGAGVVPTQISLQLLRRARRAPLVGRGTLIKAGRSLVFADGEVTQAGETVAKAAVTFARV